ncbi:hypothetical protein AAY473_027667 [Plecturocebus cupreus]
MKEAMHSGRPRQTDHLRSGVRDQPGQHGETSSLLKTKICWGWWRMSVVPATQEAEAGESLEPGRYPFPEIKGEVSPTKEYLQFHRSHPSPALHPFSWSPQEDEYYRNLGVSDTTFKSQLVH